VSVETRARAAGAAVRDVVERVEIPDPAVVVRRGTRRRRTRRAAVVAALLVVGAAVVPVVVRDDAPVTVTSAGRGPTDRAQVGDRYVPPTTTAHGVTTMPVVLPDGRPFTVRYAEGLDLAQRGFRANVAAQLLLGVSDTARVSRTLSVLRTTAAEYFAGLQPVGTYPDAQGGPVPYYVDPTAPARGGLALQFGAWLVVVPDLADPANHPDAHLSPGELSLWALGLDGWTDARGFLVLSATGEVRLDQTAKTAFVLGPTSPHSGSVSVGERWLCEEPNSDTTTPRRFPTNPPGANQGAAWCDRATGLHVAVVGPERFVNRAIRSLHIEPFSTAPRATRILLARRRVRAGDSITGVVAVVNNTGAPLTYVGCGGLFQVALTRDGKPPDVVWPLCAMQITVPPGESTQPVTVTTSGGPCETQGCSLEPDVYEAVLAQNGSDFPTAPTVRVRVLPASSP
jgi:hypothetical protein